MNSSSQFTNAAFEYTVKNDQIEFSITRDCNFANAIKSAHKILRMGPMLLRSHTQSVIRTIFLWNIAILWSNLANTFETLNTLMQSKLHIFNWITLAILLYQGIFFISFGLIVKFYDSHGHTVGFILNGIIYWIVLFYD